MTPGDLVYLVHNFYLIKDDVLQGGVVGPLWKVLLAWAVRELWTVPLFIAGVWSREVAWRGKRYRLQLGGKAVKLD